MKQLFFYLQLLAALSFASCIDEYDVLPEMDSQPILFVQGQIVSNSECTFILRHTGAMTQEEQYQGSTTLSESSYFNVVTGASVIVFGARGECFPATEVTAGHYVAHVGELASSSCYHLYVSHSQFGSFESEPMFPLDAPDIVKLEFDQPRQDQKVDFLVTTSLLTKHTCLMWDYQEYWKIQTPYSTAYEWSIEDQKIVDVNPMRNIGWSKNLVNPNVQISNADYSDGTITKYCIYQKQHNDNRFQTRYYTRVRQMAITDEELEYYQLIEKQTSGMSGLFTPMPSELPTNIHGLNGEKAMGYIGVRGKVSTAELYVNRRDVRFVATYRPYYVPDSLIVEPDEMVEIGYRICNYEPEIGMSGADWTPRWCVDCTDIFWGASLEKPDFWKDE